LAAKNLAAENVVRRILPARTGLRVTAKWQLGTDAMLSAIIITRNEAANVAACLQSVAFCSECIVVDSGSNDDTVKIAVAAGATVVTHKWAGFGAQKNFALSLARGDWVLSIDADERVSAPLAAEIVSTIGSASADGYEIARLSTFLGRPMRHSGWFPDYVLRLFRREKARFSDDLVHERVICEGPIGRLSGVLDHHPVSRLEDALRRVDSYSTAGAEMLAASRRVSFSSGITHGMWSFLRAYVVKLGFLDGREGFLLAVANAEGTYYRYMKAWLAGRQRE
jgi:glycosyltransferase involved in cell wall biosynthesis